MQIIIHLHIKHMPPKLEEITDFTYVWRPSKMDLPVLLAESCWTKTIL